MDKQVLLTISILISNRPDTVRKCLDSIKPLLEQVSSELILVDTGCGGQVRAIIEEYTDQIVEFEWCRDFSKARNAGLEKARGKWFLFLDDDEWFEDVTEIIDFFNSGEYRDYGIGVYTQRNYLEKNGSVYTDLLVGRMTKLEPDTRFIYRIHECFNKVGGRTKKFNAYVHHYGYVYASQKESRMHSLRNISLLLEEHAQDPGNMKHTLQLAQEYNILDEYSKSLELSLEAVSLYEQRKINNEYFLSSLFGNEIGCYMELYRYDEAIEKGELYLKHDRPDKLVKALIAGYLAAAYMERRDYGQVLKHTKYYWKSYQDYLRDEESFMEFVTTITNKCFEDYNRSNVLGNGIRAAVMLGEAEQAWQWFDSFDWKAPQMFVNEEMVRAVVGQMPEAAPEERSRYADMCSRMIERSELEVLVLRTMSDRCRSRETLEERVAALEAYEGVENGHWFFKLRKIVLAAHGRKPGGAAESLFGRHDELPGCGAQNTAAEGSLAAAEGGTAEIQRLAGEVWENTNASMQSIRAFAMLEAVERLGGDNAAVLEGIPFYLWQKGITAYFEQFSWEDAEWWNKQFVSILPREDAHMLVWRGMYGLSGAVRAAEKLEKEETDEGGSGEGGGRNGGIQESSIRGSGANGSVMDSSAAESRKKAEEHFDRMREGLREYAACQTKLCGRMYRPEIMAGARDMLPEEHQGAYLVSDLLSQTEEKKYGDAVGTIKEIRKLLPGLTGIMKPYLRWIDARVKQENRESRQAAGEFQVLARQIKSRLYAFMDAGQQQAALMVAKQLQALLPEDEEIRSILERLGS